MKFITYLFTLLFFFTHACAQDNKQAPHQEQKATIKIAKPILIDSSGQTVESRFPTPPNFKRAPLSENSFTAYLRELPLKPHRAEVLLHNGNIKRNHGVYDAVVDLPIGTRDLHQCADAIMRLRAEYLWNEQQYDDIHFNFTNGFRVDYLEWMKGKRIHVNGNKVSWVNRRSASNSYTDFWKYMETIFAYAGTLSLSKELKPIDINALDIGDVFIQGGSPGHAIIVVDVALHSETNEKIFLLAQSYMPAQEIQILKNPNDNNLSPWYSINPEGILRTPEWTFTYQDIKRF